MAACLPFCHRRFDRDVKFRQDLINTFCSPCLVAFGMVSSSFILNQESLPRTLRLARVSAQKGIERTF
ncbi:MAG: hypothetical protein DWI00_17515 [Planctomycetota bacterium]|nr:MAG: hypothetical protein DWI00_17515 [Planctomycetota bacterium]